MPKYEIDVTVPATYSIIYEVEADTEEEAVAAYHRDECRELDRDIIDMLWEDEQVYRVTEVSWGGSRAGVLGEEGKQ